MGVDETEVGTGTLESSGSIPVEVQGQAETSSQQQKSLFTIKTKDYRVSHHLPGTSCKYTISNSLTNVGRKCKAQM